MRIPTRTAAITSLAAILLAGLTACGGSDNDTAAPAGGDTSTSAPQASGDNAAVATVALKATGTGNPFVDARTAAEHMPMTAAALASGIVKGAKLKGDDASKAADLRAGLTHLLTEHVYLAGIAVATAYHAGADSAEFKLAAATLDENSKAVAAAVGSIVPDEEKNFLQTWRSHVNDFVTYAVGAKTEGAEGTKMKKEAVANLTAYAKHSRIFFNKITAGALPAAAVEKDFNTHITSLAAAVDAFAAGETGAYTKLKTAADHMAMTAAVLSKGIAKAAKIPGDTADDASELRSGLTGLLTTHTYLASVAVFTAYTAEGGLDGEAFKAAAAALDKNTVDLGKAIGSIAGAEKETTFLQVWRSHINDFVTYAKGDATGDQALKDKGLTNLDAYRTAAGGFFADITGGALPADAVAEELKMHIETLAGAIDSLKAALIKS
jgi:hypothetical protein